MRRCAFCNSAKAEITGEDIWSLWIGRLYGPPAKDRYKFRQRDAEGRTLREWHGSKLEHKARVVCGRCNNGWMSDMENLHAKPTLKDMIQHGTRLSLLPLGIMTIAAWSFMKAVVVDHMHTARKPFFSQSIRRAFMESRMPPDGTQIWIAAFNGAPDMRGHVTTFYHRGRRHSLLEGFEFYVATYVATYFIVQVVGKRRVKGRARRRPFPFLDQDPVWDDLAIPIWPGEGDPIEWPPRRAITRPTLERFTDRFKRVRFQVT